MADLTCADGHQATNPYATCCPQGHPLQDPDDSSEVQVPPQEADQPPTGHAPRTPPDTVRDATSPPEDLLVTIGAHSVTIRERQFIIGRSHAEAPLDLAEALADYPGVSRRHAEVTVSARSITLHVLNTTNGTFANGQLLEAGSSRTIGPSDTVRLGYHCGVHLRVSPAPSGQS